MPDFVRFQSAVPGRAGLFPGVFALANGLARHGRLSPADLDWWRSANARLSASYVDPTAVEPGCYDAGVNPGARAWFRRRASAQIGLTRDYLRLLDRYGVGWVELTTSSPGRIVYADDVQVVAVPYAYEQDWPLREGPLTPDVE